MARGQGNATFDLRPNGALRRFARELPSASWTWRARRFGSAATLPSSVVNHWSIVNQLKRRSYHVWRCVAWSGVPKCANSAAEKFSFQVFSSWMDKMYVKEWAWSSWYGAQTVVWKAEETKAFSTLAEMSPAVATRCRAFRSVWKNTVILATPVPHLEWILTKWFWRDALVWVIVVDTFE